MPNIHSHRDNFTVTGFLTGNPTTGANLDFSKILVIDSLANSSQSGMTSTAVGSNNSVLTTIADSDALTSGVGAGAQLVIENIFAPDSHPAEVYLLSVDLVGTDTWESALLALEAVMPDYFAVVVVSQTQSVIADVVDGVLQAGISMPHIVFAGISTTADATASNATWLAGTLGAQTTAEKQVLFLTYHNKNGDTAADFAEYAGRILSYDFDKICPSSNMILTNTPELAKLASATAKSNLDANNINHALPMTSVIRTYVDKGVMLDGTPLYHILTKLWLQDRLQVAALGVKLSYTARGEKLPMDPSGSTVVLAALANVVAQGERAKHLLSRDAADQMGKTPLPFVRMEAITADDLSNRKLRATIQQYTLEDAREITVDFYLSS